MPSVPGYVHTPGNHCGSTALRNLLAFHGIELSEEMAFGLGAGACFYYLTLEDASPSRWFNGRTARLEENFRELTGAALEMRTFAAGDGEAWEAARAEVDAGNPALLLTDLYYLDHYGNSAHFPGHAVVLAGYDERGRLLSDTGFEELQTTRLENLARAATAATRPTRSKGTCSRSPPPRSTASGSWRRSRRRSRGRRRRCSSRPGASSPACRRSSRLAAEAGSWPEAAEDWQWCARFAYQVIERRGTGGGAFRLMYSRFLEEAGRAEAPLAAAAAARWTELAEAFHAASESDEPEPSSGARSTRPRSGVREAEQRLWTALALSGLHGDVRRMPPYRRGYGSRPHDDRRRNLPDRRWRDPQVRDQRPRPGRQRRHRRPDPDDRRRRGPGPRLLQEAIWSRRTRAAKPSSKSAKRAAGPRRPPRELTPRY